MKKLFLTLAALFAIVYAKAQFEMEGRVYFDAGQTKIKEIYHYYLQYSYNIRPGKGDTVISDVPVAIRHGACIFYREDGTIEMTGQYKDGKKTGEWLIYDTEGKKVARKENYG